MIQELSEHELEPVSVLRSTWPVDNTTTTYGVLVLRNAVRNINNRITKV